MQHLVDVITGKMAATEDQCCTLQPFKSDYEPVGEKVTIKVEGKEDMDVYITSPSSPSPTKVLVAIYGASYPELQRSSFFRRGLTTI